MARTLLIVDDEESVRSALKRALRKESYEVFTASGPEEALELLQQQPVDLVVSDHLMPRMTGLEFLKLVHDRYPGVGRIMLTGHADMETAIKAINEGEIYRLLQKPWDDLELKVILHIAFEQIDLERENRRLLSALRRQAGFIRDLETRFPGISNVVRNARGAIVITEEELLALRH
jgi:two-component system probable response regulator PhcQ